MTKTSAGILLFKRQGSGLRVLLAHPGGPFWSRKDAASWTIPKGAVGDGEEPLAAAMREFHEETGFTPEGTPLPLEPLRQPSGKIIIAWALEGDCDPAALHSNTFQLEWPPHSGKLADFPEIDRADWFDVPAARTKILKGQSGFIDQLCALLGCQ